MLIKGIKKASGATYDFGYYSPEYVEIFYDRAEGKCWTVYQYSLGHNSWTVYHDRSIIKICNAYEHMSMQQIADAIRDRVAEQQALETCAY